jgi:tRNA(Arg) A34 adenosine deaminase TadA
MCLAAIYWARIDRVFYALSKRHAAEIGFADEFIAQELAKSSDRQLPMIQVMRPEALVAFNEWQHRKDRIAY